MGVFWGFFGELGVFLVGFEVFFWRVFEGFGGLGGVWWVWMVLVGFGGF